jgi:hypothetical protein
VAHVFHAVIFGNQGRRAGDDLELADHLAGAEEAMITREGIAQVVRGLPFSAHENPLPGGEHVVKNDQAFGRLGGARLGIFEFTLFAVLFGPLS